MNELHLFKAVSHVASENQLCVLIRERQKVHVIQSNTEYFRVVQISFHSIVSYRIVLYDVLPYHISKICDNYRSTDASHTFLKCILFMDSLVNVVHVTLHL